MNNQYSEAFLVPNPITPCQAVIFDESVCLGCNTCVDVCRSSVIVPNPEKDKPPICLYPDECWFCGCCVDDCPVEGAIRMEHPLNMRVGWRRKSTGEWFRIGMKDPPPAVTRPVVK